MLQPTKVQVDVVRPDSKRKTPQAGPGSKSLAHTLAALQHFLKKVQELPVLSAGPATTGRNVPGINSNHEGPSRALVLTGGGVKLLRGGGTRFEIAHIKKGVRLAED